MTPHSAATYGDAGGGSLDVWLVKVDGSGNVLWQMRYGSAGGEYFPRVYGTSDGGVIVLSYAGSFGGPWLAKRLSRALS